MLGGRLLLEANWAFWTMTAWESEAAMRAFRSSGANMSAKNKEIVEKVNAAFAEGSTEKFLSFCADDVEWTMVGDKTVKGKDAIRQWMASMGNMEPPKFTVDNVIAEGDFVTAYGDMTMKDKDGKAASYSYCDIYRFRGGKIVELRAFVIKTEAKRQTSGAA
jgi:ketosteroid isomerase-like protein